MIFKARSKHIAHRVHTWDTAQPGAWGDPVHTSEAVAQAWREYQAFPIDTRISEHDDMLASDDEAGRDYMRIGQSALRIISEAMIATGRVQFQDVLDLPCGGGRVTRHLCAFLPTARIHVGDVDQAKLRSVVEQFGALQFDFSQDFLGDPATNFDLIFSGSLLTHFDEDLFKRAVDFFVRALKPSGLAILTIHGRTSATASLSPASIAGARQVEKLFREHMKEKGANYKVKLDLAHSIRNDFKTDGFGYVLSPSWTALYGQSYGGSYSSPSWLMKLFECRSDCIIVGFKEKSYGDMQDVIIVQKI